MRFVHGAVSPPPPRSRGRITMRAVPLLFLASSILIHGTARGGSLIVVNPPGSVYTEAYGINDADLVVGAYDTSSQVGNTHGFLRSASGTYTPFDAPAAVGETSARGVNNAGHVVGIAFTSGFLLSGGVFTYL